MSSEWLYFFLGMGLGFSFGLCARVPIRGDAIKERLSKLEDNVELIWKRLIMPKDSEN